MSAYSKMKINKIAHSAIKGFYKGRAKPAKKVKYSKKAMQILGGYTTRGAKIGKTETTYMPTVRVPRGKGKYK